MKMAFKIFIFSILMFPVKSVFADFREDFHNTELNKENVERMLSKYGNGDSPVTVAYLGVCNAIMAQYVFLPTTKLKSFYDGKEKIDTSIESDEENGEQRYLRLLIQLNAPSFLFYNGDINADLDVFIQDVRRKNIDQKWSFVFIDNLLKGKKLSEEQIKELTQLKKEL